MKKKNNHDDRVDQSGRINELEESNKNLQEKLKLLRIQLMSQSQLQLASLSHSRSASLNRSRTNLHSSRHFHSTTGLKTEDGAKPSPRKHPDSIIHQLHILQEEFDSVKEQHKTRIAELEKQIAQSQNSISPTKLRFELNENIELIKLKRLSKKQSAQILSLQSQLELSNAELKELQEHFSTITNDKDALHRELSDEKCVKAKLLSDISILKESTKFLEDQVNDLQKEKITLKEHNDNLLKLSLQQKSCADDSNKSNVIKQMKELQENLQRENYAKLELSSKLAEAELLIDKYKNEILKNNSLINDLQATNQAIKNEVEKLRSSPKLENVLHQTKSLSTEDKSVMTSPLNYDVGQLSTFHDHISVSDMNVNDDSVMKMKLCSLTEELGQHKELLRVQCEVSNKYKKEVEELQKLFQKNEKLSSEYLHGFQSVLRKHEEHLLKIENLSSKEHSKFIFTELSKILSVKKLGSYQDYIDCFDKLLFGYASMMENPKLSSNRSALVEKGTVVDKLMHSVDKIVQVEVNQEKSEETDDEKSVVISCSNRIENASDKTAYVVFGLQLKKASFDYFSDHLMKSSGNNPRIFLTWNFLDDNEHQAYTPTISVKEGIFDCSCQYEGPYSEFLFLYLKKHGIRIEIHLVQENISVRLAETRIDTSSALDHPNKFQEFMSKFENDNIRGNVTGTFILRKVTTAGKSDSSQN